MVEAALRSGHFDEFSITYDVEILAAAFKAYAREWPPVTHGLGKNERVQTGEYARRQGITRRAARRELQYIMDLGMAEIEGAGVETKYRILEDIGVTRIKELRSEAVGVRMEKYRSKKKKTATPKDDRPSLDGLLAGRVGVIR